MARVAKRLLAPLLTVIFLSVITSPEASATFIEETAPRYPDPPVTILDNTIERLTNEIAVQDALLALEKARAEAAAEAKRQEDAVKERLALTPELFSLLTREDINALQKTPCAAIPAPEATNGNIPLTALCKIENKNHFLKPHATVAYDALSKAYERNFKKPLCITDSYRSYDAQVVAKAVRGKFAAKPGTSNHGWGLAIDLCDGVNNFGTPQFEWMKKFAPSFGWHHPDWAEPNGSLPEPWHWEYVTVANPGLPE